MKCPNCGGESGGSLCQFCGSELPKTVSPITITNNYFGDDSVDPNKLGVKVPCPNCGSTKIGFKRERVGASSKTTSRKKYVGRGRKGSTNSTNHYRTIGLCQNCGYTWIPESSQKSKELNSGSNTKWWILGWIFIFPVPLTILMLRNKSLDNKKRYGIIALAWLIYLIIVISASGDKKDNKTSSNSTDSTSTTVESTVESVSESTGETSKISVESISLDIGSDVIYLGQSEKITASIYPTDANSIEITWNSDNESVATVDNTGMVTAVGEGTTTIHAVSPDGVDASCELTVDASKRLMTVKASSRRDDDNNIGDEWTKSYKINDESVQTEYLVSIGDSYKCWAKFSEDDSKPDVSEQSSTHIVSQEDFENGFEVVFDLNAEENAGPNSGQQAHFVVTFSFSI